MTSRFGLFALLLIVLPAVGIQAEAASDPSSIRAVLDTSPVIRQAGLRSLSPDQIRDLVARDGDRIKVWVLFTDKGVRTDQEYRSLAAGVDMTARAWKRRAKMDMDRVVFADLPVYRPYLRQIEALGAKYRHSSRWLNAASFEIDAPHLQQLAALPFVSEIRPLAVYRRPNTSADEIRNERGPTKALLPDSLDYGLAAEQLAQINVPAAHAQGLDGSGVTLAIFDTGFRKSHQAFAQHYADDRVLAEWDFVFNDSNVANEDSDWTSAWNHGTYIWSTAAGSVDGVLIGPAYKANFILCKTEDVRSETQVEEDNWVAALEWVDSLGADVVTSSLSYQNFDDGTGYVFEDLDGWTGISSAAASMAASMGIVVCNAAGNSGPDPSTTYPPADAHDIVTVGAVDASGLLATFSSRGPTADGRIKPEVVARGVATRCATATTDQSYGSASGTSLSTPLVAGVVCLLVQARPTFAPQFIRQALMETSNNATSPDNNYGWGLVNAGAALGWGANFSADLTVGEAPATVQFYDSSTVPPTAWLWRFGDGDSAVVQNPTHTYNQAGAYDVSLTIQTALGPITNIKENYIILLADTATFVSDSGYAGSKVTLSVNLVNTLSLERIVVPFKFLDQPGLTVDSAARGARTGAFEYFTPVLYDPTNNHYGWEMTADIGGGTPNLPPGSGEIMKIFFTVDSAAVEGTFNTIDSARGSKTLEVTSPLLSYEPRVASGSLLVLVSVRGDVNGNGQRDIADLVDLVQYMFFSGKPPVTLKAGDADASGNITISDLLYIVDYFFNGGPPPAP